ncbi:PilZ domain-containing protein [Bdellovibrio reynosensis]|uniref:PilZ domain-containing protein n=1 Tax=Bdellovibrio reynosensis TaxID=2835041 RepID=A0ABY4CKR0_9BACT|nr:PilZ domain-containing protein [Bdellovibrio reynosensis]UOF02830.1 PilZ domain-containing protein [Bdellovibrio reynosensis]
MTSLARYHGRSPRYILNTEDDSLVRVAGPKQVPWEEGTEIKNVSLTGLAFTAPDDLCPLLGEVIKIQFTPPGSRQMACYGIVTRLENITEQRTLVGVHFYKLEMSQRIVLAQGLARKFKETQDRSEIDGLLNRTKESFSLASAPQLTLMAILGFAWGAIIWHLLRFEYVGLYKMLLRLFS